MYFVPKKNRWLYRIAHIRPLYRYGIVILGAASLFLGWRYVLYTWFDAIIQQEQVIIFQLQQQLIQQSNAERHNNDLVQQLPLLHYACAQNAVCCIGEHCTDQCSYIFDEAQKAGVTICGYHTEKENKKSSWKQSRSTRVSLQGSLDQIEIFLGAIKKSSRFVQCTSVSLQHGEGKLFTAECMIQFIVI